MARFLIVGAGERASALRELIEASGHVVSLVARPARDSLEHVAIVCWLTDEPPAGFLERSIDSSMRGFLYQGYRAPELAVRNRIPVALLPAPDEPSRWLRGAIAGIAMLGIPLKDDRLL